MFWHGVLGFICLIINAFNVTDNGNERLGMLRPVGGALIGIALVEYAMAGSSDYVQWFRVTMQVLSVLFAIFAVYANVFARDPGAWRRAARQEKNTNKNKLHDTGLYALCRHPGTWGMIGLCLCMIPAVGLPWTTALVYILLDVAVGMFTEQKSYLRTVPGYADYMFKTPFLIPYKEGFQKCFGKKTPQKSKGSKK